MGFFSKNKDPAIERGAEPKYMGSGRIPVSEATYQLLRSKQLIERTLAFVKFKNKNPNPFETMNEFICHLVNAHTYMNGVTIVKSGAFFYVADALLEVVDGYQFTSHIVLGRPRDMVGTIGMGNVWTIRSEQIATMQRVTPEANSLLRTAINTVLRRLVSLGKINLIWKKKGWKSLSTQAEKNEKDISILSDMVTSSGGVMTASTEDDFFQVQPDYSKADGTEVAGSIAIFSYVTGISPEFLRGAQSDQQVVNSVLQIMKPLLTTLAEKVKYFEFSFDFTDLATLQQSQSKGAGDSRVQTSQALQSAHEVQKK